jgi:hypothetical protein
MLEIHDSLKTLRESREAPTREANGPVGSSRWTQGQP